MPQDNDSPAVAYSYVRFSTREQLKGDSLRRQKKATADWCQKNGVKLDTSITLHDLGKSAFLGDHKKNPDRHALAAFLKMVQDGKVPRGSYLIVESLDRLTREHVRAALMLCLGLIEAGVRIVQLSPSELVYDETADVPAIMLMLVELSRGHGESKRKSDLSGPAWAEKKKRARTGEVQNEKTQSPVKGMLVLTHKLPSWVEEKAGKPVAIPKRAKVVKEIFRLAAKGYGAYRIVQKLTEDGVPAFGSRESYIDEEKKQRYRGTGDTFGAGHWTRGYVSKLLRDRRVLGEYQPRSKDGKPDGDPIAGFFPVVITEAEFYAARRGAGDRRVTPGKPKELEPETVAKVRTMLDAGTPAREVARVLDVPHHKVRRIQERMRREKGEVREPARRQVFLFSGLLKDARGGSCQVVTTGEGTKVIANQSAVDGRAKFVSFPLATFERAILSQLREIDPNEVLGTEQPDETQSLAAELAEVEASIAAIADDLDKHGDSPTQFKRLRQKEARKAALVKLVADAQQRAASPLSASWGEALTLLEALDSVPDQEEARLRLRAILRRIIDSVYVLVVPLRQDRLAYVQVNFKGEPFAIPCDSPHGEHMVVRLPFRHYFIVHRQARSNGTAKQAGRWAVNSLKHPDAAKALVPFHLTTDLSDPFGAELAEDDLKGYSEDAIERLLKKAGKPLP
jgi:DNA invertase Pin-like site-specific DNA recombinase